MHPISLLQPPLTLNNVIPLHPPNHQSSIHFPFDLSTLAWHYVNPDVKLLFVTSANSYYVPLMDKAPFEASTDNHNMTTLPLILKPTINKCHNNNNDQCTHIDWINIALLATLIKHATYVYDKSTSRSFFSDHQCYTPHLVPGFLLIWSVPGLVLF